MVGRLVSFWKGNLSVSGAMLNFGGVQFLNLTLSGILVGMSKTGGNWSRLKFAPNGIHDCLGNEFSLFSKNVGFLQVAGEKTCIRSTLLHRISNHFFQLTYSNIDVMISEITSRVLRVRNFWEISSSKL